MFQLFFRFTFLFDQCDEITAADISVKLIQNYHVDVILGPTCNYPTITAALISGYFDKPLFSWGLSTSSELDNASRFRMISVLAVNSFSLGVALHLLLLKFEWNQFAFIYYNSGEDQTCDIMKNDVQSYAINSLVYVFFQNFILLPAEFNVVIAAAVIIL
ncbi:hypothetical protein ANCCAN_11385 [Ancylostoma caninum]|uniref:Receptor ligand binding region domain-containing protein n=1 Tax=Ancylostoma caninum TaxID=29170 RepID=A0A368GDZ8_ANCCA|nr:hypothetical protein ANCCAN_11385 [Ancylostoma caninum]